MKKIIIMVIICSCIFVYGCNRYKKTVPNQNQNKQAETQKGKESETGKSERNESVDAAMINGKLTVTNPDDMLVLVNKIRNLPANWAPDDLVVPDVRFTFRENLEKKHMRREAAEALKDLFDAAGSQGIELFAVSGYRSYNTQKSVYNNEVSQVGKETANKTVALPGQSEHQTGLSIDVSSAGMYYLLKESFGGSKEGKWLAEHAKDYGYIIRYPKGKEKITGYSYEPWHIRYVGKDAAIYIASNDITLDEYIIEAANK